MTAGSLEPLADPLMLLRFYLARAQQATLDGLLEFV